MPAQSSAHVERNSVLDTVRHSCSWGSPTGRVGKCGASSAVGRLQARCEASKIAPLGPTVLDRAEGDLEGLEICSGDCATGNGDLMAAETIQTVLVEVVAVERTRTPTCEFGDPHVDQQYGGRQSILGRAPRSRGTAQAGIRDFGAHRFTTDAEKRQETIANVDNLSAESCGPNGLH